MVDDWFKPPSSISPVEIKRLCERVWQQHGLRSTNKVAGWKIEHHSDVAGGKPSIVVTVLSDAQHRSSWTEDEQKTIYRYLRFPRRRPDPSGSSGGVCNEDTKEAW